MTQDRRREDAAPICIGGNAPRPLLPFDWLEIANENILLGAVAINHLGGGEGTLGCHGGENAKLLIRRSDRVKIFKITYFFNF